MLKELFSIDKFLSKYSKLHTKNYKRLLQLSKLFRQKKTSLILITMFRVFSSIAIRHDSIGILI